MNSSTSQTNIETKENSNFPQIFSTFLKDWRSGQIEAAQVNQFIQNYPFDKQAIVKSFEEMSVYFKDQNIVGMSNKQLLIFLNNNENPIVNKIKSSILQKAFEAQIPRGIIISKSEIAVLLGHLWEG